MQKFPLESPESQRLRSLEKEVSSLRKQLDECCGTVMCNSSAKEKADRVHEEVRDLLGEMG